MPGARSDGVEVGYKFVKCSRKAELIRFLFEVGVVGSPIIAPGFAPAEAKKSLLSFNIDIAVEK